MKNNIKASKTQSAKKHLVKKQNGCEQTVKVLSKRFFSTDPQPIIKEQTTINMMDVIPMNMHFLISLLPLTLKITVLCTPLKGF